MMMVRSSSDAFSVAVSGEERDRRAQLEDERREWLRRHDAHVRHVMLCLVEEQMCLAELAETRRRRDVVAAWFAETDRMSAFFWFKLGDALRDSTILDHRRSCAVLWLQQAFERNAVVAHMEIAAEELAARRELGRVLFRELHAARAAEAAGEVPSVRRYRRAQQRQLADEERLAALLHERRRGIAAAMLHEFAVAFEASRIRVEWAEDAARRRLEAAPRPAW
jgi:hypothetical protein